MRNLAVVAPQPQSPQPELSLRCTECDVLSSDLNRFCVVSSDDTGVHVWRWGNHPDGKPGAVCCEGGCSVRAANRLIEEMTT